MPKKPNVIAVSYAKRALEKDSRDRNRMREYASVLESYHLIVFTNSKQGLPAVQQEGNLFLHATNGKNKLGSFIKAVQIGRSIVKSQRQTEWTVSSQDPFETSLVAQLIASGSKNAKHHIQIHGDVFNPLFLSGNFLDKLRHKYAKWIVKRVASIRVVSKRIKQSLLNLGVPENRITILPIEPQLESFLGVGRERIYENKASLNLLFVGRFSEEKNIPLLLRSVKKAQEAGVSCSLKILGSGDEKPYLEKMIAELSLEPSVEFLPWNEDVASVMKEADVLCLSSNHEGYALVLVEAIATGLPVITTDVGCAGELVENLKNGLVVEVGDVDAYAEAIEILSRSYELRERLGKSAHETGRSLKCTRAEYLEEIRKSFTLPI